MNDETANEPTFKYYNKEILLLSYHILFTSFQSHTSLIIFIKFDFREAINTLKTWSTFGMRLCAASYPFTLKQLFIY